MVEVGYPWGGGEEGEAGVVRLRILVVEGCVMFGVEGLVQGNVVISFER